MRYIGSTLSKKQIFFSRTATSIAVVFCGCLSLVFSLLSRGYLILPSIAVIIGALFLTLALIQQNTLLLWLFPVGILGGTAYFLLCLDITNLSKIYPIFIVLPALGSFFCGLYSGLWNDHKKIIIIFLPAAMIFCLNAIFGLNIITTLAIFLIFFGILAAIYTFIKKDGEANE